ncbi:18S rRNA (guanine1575-N7)-methyltransferase [Sorochytrium milnesiophthora]
MSRPEHLAPPEIFYGDTEARKYTQNTHIADVQARLSHRALELLALPAAEPAAQRDNDMEEDGDEVQEVAEESGKPAFLLDIGCGSGLSGEVIEEYGHYWVGVDIAPSMLEVAAERELDGDLFLQDIGQGLGFRPGTFDGAISISVLQWLCNADAKSHNPRARLSRFFTTLYTALARGARAVFQFYPENDAQVQMIVSAALKSGFTGGIVVDYPNSTKARKTYLVLFAGQRDGATSSKPSLPQGLSGDGGDDEQSVRYSAGKLHDPHARRRANGKRKGVKDKEWIQNKKDQARSKGVKQVANDSKYTGRKRRPKF